MLRVGDGLPPLLGGVARPKGLSSSYTTESDDNARGADGAKAPKDPLAGYQYRPGARGPRTTLRPEMVEVIAADLARYGVLRKAAAKAGTTEDCLSRWLTRGRQQVADRKRSLYTELLVAVEQAKSHRMGWLLEQGELSLHDKHSNPRFATWLLAVLAPKQFTVPKDGGRAAAGGLAGTPFELVKPEEAAASLEAKLHKFLAMDEEQRAADAAASESAEVGG